MPRAWSRADKQHGFSLIELMVGVIIIGILLAKGVPSFRDWIQNTQIRNAAEAIQDGLQLAKAKAVQLNSQVQFVLGAASNWTVGCVTPTATCPATIQSRSTAGSTNAAVAAAQATIVFDGLGRITPVPAAALAFNISNPTGGACVAAAGTMRCLRIEVSTGGGIRMCDPAFSPTGAGGLPAGPQGCLP